MERIIFKNDRVFGNHHDKTWCITTDRGADYGGVSHIRGGSYDGLHVFEPCPDRWYTIDELEIIIDFMKQQQANKEVS